MKVWSHKFHFKPISANKLWYRAKQMTKDYREWRDAVRDDIVENQEWPFGELDSLEFDIKVGFSSKLADIDNSLKGLLDTWQYLFGFNDRCVYKITVEKEIVKKGQEYFDVTVKEYDK